MRADDRIQWGEPVPWGWEVIGYDLRTDEQIVSPSALAPTLKMSRFFNWTMGWLTVSAKRHWSEWWKVRPRWGR